MAPHQFRHPKTLIFNPDVYLELEMSWEIQKPAISTSACWVGTLSSHRWSQNLNKGIRYVRNRYVYVRVMGRCHARAL